MTPGHTVLPYFQGTPIFAVLWISYIITGTSPVMLTRLTQGRHVLRISPLGCSGGSKTLDVQFNT